MEKLIQKFRDEVDAWDAGLTYEEEALLAIYFLARERLEELGCPLAPESYSKVALLGCTPRGQKNG